MQVKNRASINAKFDPDKGDLLAEVSGGQCRSLLFARGPD